MTSNNSSTNMQDPSIDRSKRKSIKINLHTTYDYHNLNYKPKIHKTIAENTTGSNFYLPFINSKRQPKLNNVYSERQSMDTHYID